MRLAISNIVRDVSEDHGVAELLARYGIDAMDIVPGKCFPEPENAEASRIAQVKMWWSDRGIELTGMQGLLFGSTGFNVFGPADVQGAVLRRLNAVCRIASGLGATRLVFGSPCNRDRAGLDEEKAASIATAYFRRLGDIARAHGVIVCLEPNPSRYGCNFMTGSGDTADIVVGVAHPSIRMQLDIGAITINNEDLATVIPRYRHLFGQFHASEPDLLPLGDGTSNHAAAAQLVALHLPHHVVAIEMRATGAESHFQSIERALRTAIEFYRPNNRPTVDDKQRSRHG